MGEWLTGEADRREVLTAGVAAVLVPGELLLLKDEDLDTAFCQIVATGGARGSCSNNQDIMVVTVLVLKHNNRINQQQEKEKERS